MRELLETIAEDIRYYARVDSPAAPAASASVLRTLTANRGLWLLVFQRLGFHALNRCRRFGLAWWLLRPVRALGRFYAACFCKSDILEECVIEGPIYLSNRGYIIFGPARVGAHAMIHDHCTFGYALGLNREGRPHIGARAWIGSNSIVMGPLTIGDGATVLPGSVVTSDVAPGAVVRGNPAQLVRDHFDNAVLRASTAAASDLPACPT